jgi:ankyrin repeat protein
LSSTTAAATEECHKNHTCAITNNTTTSNNGTICHTDNDNNEAEQVRKTLIEWKLAAVEALLRANRQLATLPDSFGRTPLHLACMEDASDDDQFQHLGGSSGGHLAAAAILRANGFAASVTDQEQRTALHFLVARNHHIPIQLLRQLLDLYPKAVLQRDIVNETPIDIVERRRGEISNATEVLEILQDCLQNLDKDLGTQPHKG